MELFNNIVGLLSGANGSAPSTTIGPGAMSHMSPDQWGTTVQNPNTTGGQGGGGIGGLFADPNFQSFLAGTGAALDPDGVGGAVGKATQGMIQNKQMGKAMEKQDARWKAVIDAIGTGSVGKATIKEDGKGGTTLTLGAPEGGLGSLNQPVQQQPQQDGFEQAFFNTFSGMLKKMGINVGGGM